MTYTILSLELHRTRTDPLYEKMHVVLENQNWKVQPEMPAVWQKAWTDGFPAGAYVDAAKKDVTVMAEAIGLVDYDATVVVSHSAAASWSLRPDDLSAFERFLAAESLDMHSSTRYSSMAMAGGIA